MKKIVMIILTAGLLFGAAACQSKEDKTTPTPEATSSMPEATPADKPETTEPTMAPEAKQGEEKTITGKSAISKMSCLFWMMEKTPMFSRLMKISKWRVSKMVIR